LRPSVNGEIPVIQSENQRYFFSGGKVDEREIGQLRTNIGVCFRKLADGRSSRRIKLDALNQTVFQQAKEFWNRFDLISQKPSGFSQHGPSREKRFGQEFGLLNITNVLGIVVR